MKYIIELEDVPYSRSEADPNKLYRVKGFNALVFDETGRSKLTPYTEQKAKMQMRYELPKRLKRALDRTDMTQRDLAAIIGITEVSMSRYMTGDRTPKAPTIARLAQVLGVSTDYLLGLED